MFSYLRRPKSGHLTCYLNRTYHVLTTQSYLDVDNEGLRVQNLALSQGPKRLHPRARRGSTMPNAKCQGTATAPFGEPLQEANAQRQIDLILNIDVLLGRAAKSLIELAAKCQPEPEKDPHQKICSGALYFPPWVGGDSGPPATGKKFLLTRALCCASLQRLWENKRRFQWLTREDVKVLDALQSRLANTFIPTKPQPSLEDYANCLSSETFGGVNPLTASQVFRALIYGGENKAHKGIGFLAFFIMVWFLRRRFPEGNIQGVSLEPSRPTAYVTAKCLFPIKLLADICERRARLYEDLRKLITKLEEVAGQRSFSDRWKFASTLSELSINLSDMSKIAIARDAFRSCSDSIEALADGLDSYAVSATVWEQVKSKLVEALRAAAAESQTIWCEADRVVTQIKDQIFANLKPAGVRELEKKYNIKIGGARENERGYWDDHIGAAKQALDICEDAVAYLKSASKIQFMVDLPDTPALLESLGGIANANRDLSDKFHKTGADSARWCRSVVEREIAHASAGNATDFDAAELASAIATAVRWRQMTSQLEIADAICKTVEGGGRPDGSWIPGQPFYTQGRLLGAYPITSDIVWPLVTAIKQFPEVNAADDAIERYVSWLERGVSEVAIKDANQQIKITGWASERSRERNRVDLWATAFSINALLEIRDLAEDRIWLICKQRFNIVSPTKSLAGVDPVDLGAKHGYRLHRRLSKMAREAQMGEPEAEYAFMLHGPPGSSKTAMAQAVAKEMWRGPSASASRPARLIRITPADFTRFGEDRLDSEARLVFTLLTHVRGTVVLFDEVDDLLHKRERDSSLRPVFMELITPAMLNRLADLRESCPRQEVCYIFATNFIQNIEAALLRRGRLDAAIPVVYPDTESRVAIVERRMGGLREAKRDGTAMRLENLKQKIVDETAFWPWMTIEDFLDEICELRSDQEAEPRLLGEKYLLELNKPAYKVRALCEPPTPRELLNEFLHYSFSGWQTLEQYKKEGEGGFREQLIKWGADPEGVGNIVNRGAQLWSLEGRRKEKTHPLPTKRGEPEVPAKAA